MSWDHHRNAITSLFPDNKIPQRPQVGWGMSDYPDGRVWLMVPRSQKRWNLVSKKGKINRNLPSWMDEILGIQSKDQWAHERAKQKEVSPCVRDFIIYLKYL